jgi:hypothetical protein
VCCVAPTQEHVAVDLAVVLLNRVWEIMSEDAVGDPRKEVEWCWRA